VSAAELALRVLDALEDGDAARVVSLLHNVLEGTQERHDRARCACGFTAEWPGLLWQHHCPLEEAA
jgi:hypothetical protein